MAAQTTTFRSDIGSSTPDSITVFGRDFTSEILGHLSFGDMAFLELTQRTPNADESRMFNAMLVTLVEHGITPSAIVARLTYLGAPESLQAAVASGLCGLGTVFVGSIEGSAKMLYDVMPKPDPKADFAALAAAALAKLERDKVTIPGIGHPLHKPVDPRAPRLLQIAQETGFAGPYVKLVGEIAAEAERRKGKSLPVNATGMLGALCCEMAFDGRICRGLGVMARAVGLVGHILEEMRQPMALDVWRRTEAAATAHLREGKPQG